jgi:hypothetical protein
VHVKSSAVLLFICFAAACNSEAAVHAGASVNADAFLEIEWNAQPAPQPLALIATPSPSSVQSDPTKCDPNYDPCVPVDSDVDCEGGGGDGPSYVRGPVRVIRRDIYRLDHDHDGIGCED